MVEQVDREWTDAATFPPHGEPVMAECHEYNNPNKPKMQHVVWFWEGQYREYPETGGVAYCDRWKFLPNSHRTEATAALEERVKLLETVAGYAKHNGLCGIIGGYDVCTCGLDAAREALNDPKVTS